MTLEEWNQPKEVSVAAMTEAVEQLREAKNDYADAKAVSDGKHAIMKEKEAYLVALLQDANITEYIAEGVGKVKLKVEPYVPTPKTPEQKKQFFEWIKNNMGLDAYYAYLNVNSNTLQSLYKEKLADGIDIDGLDQPTTRTRLSLTKSR